MPPPRARCRRRFSLESQASLPAPLTPSCGYPTRSSLVGLQQATVSGGSNEILHRDSQALLRNRSTRRGHVRLHPRPPKGDRASPQHALRSRRFIRAVAPYREDLVVAVECTFTWYWLADLCAREGIAFVFGHALYTKAIHGAKAKNDRIDSRKIAGLLRGGLIPQSYVYPAEMRSTCDLMRRRIHFVRHRSQLLAHIQNTHHQYNCVSPGRRIAYRSNRGGIAKALDGIAIQMNPGG